jgi:predicted porin
MIKKLLPTMIGAALAGGMTATSADVTISGHIDMSVNNIDAEATESIFLGPTNVLDMWDDTNLHCTTCSIGFSGSEDLGNGLSAIFKLDYQFDMVNRNSSGSITDRDQWVGLKGGFGQLRAGTISTVYKSHGAMIDPLYRRYLQARDVGLQSGLHSGAGEEIDGRADNTFRYDSPSFNGFKVGAHYTLDSDEFDGRFGGAEDNNPYGVGASYSNGGALAFADYITNDGNNNSEQEEATAWKLGGSYTLNAFKVFGQYEDVESKFTTLGDAVEFAIPGEVDLGLGAGPFVNADGSVWHLGGTYTMGNNTLYAAYGQGDGDIDDLGSTDAWALEYDTWTLAFIHSLSKRTSLMAGYNSFDGQIRGNTPPLTDFDGESDILSVGVKHKF